MKRLHAGAKSRKHGCARCGSHKRQVTEFRKKSGRRYTLCAPCAASLGEERGRAVARGWGGDLQFVREGPFGYQASKA